MQAVTASDRDERTGLKVLMVVLNALGG